MYALCTCQPRFMKLHRKTHLAIKPYYLFFLFFYTIHKSISDMLISSPKCFFKFCRIFTLKRALFNSIPIPILLFSYAEMRVVILPPNGSLAPNRCCEKIVIVKNVAHIPDKHSVIVQHSIDFSNYELHIMQIIIQLSQWA